MSDSKGILKGFIIAAVVCVVSFLAIYFVFPDVSDKFFKMSFKNRHGEPGIEKVQDAVEDIAGKGLDKALELKDQLVDKAADKVVDKVVDVVRSVKGGAD